jgi:hypothetical protein
VLGPLFPLNNAMEIYSRQVEQRVLSQLLERDRASFLAVFGRRRIGKTYLIRNFYLNRGTLFHVTGVPKETAKNQRANFNEDLCDVFHGGESQKAPATWREAFDSLRKAVASHSTQGKIIVFLDELPWLASHKSGFVQALTYCWNRYFEADSRIILIVCGSAASWMINNIIDDKGGLYGRLTHQMRLLPFNLAETEEYLNCRGIALDRRQISEIYMATGGVAKYLDLVPRGRSSAQVVQHLFFSRGAQSLSGEFDHLFRSLFQHSERHLNVVRVLAKRQEGYTRSQLVQEANLNSGSVQLRVIRELKESGFISDMRPFRAKKKGSIYRLSDEFSLFCIKWERELKDSQVQAQDNYWMELHRTPRWRAWSGYAFERLCFNHIPQILRALGISGMHCNISGWSTRGGSGDKRGAQVDMVIDRPDHCIHLCEMKFSEGPFVITGHVAEALKEKVARFVEDTGTRKTIFLTLITCHGIGAGRERLTIHNELTVDDLFVTA